MTKLEFVSVKIRNLLLLKQEDLRSFHSERDYRNHVDKVRCLRLEVGGAGARCEYFVRM